MRSFDSRADAADADELIVKYSNISLAGYDEVQRSFRVRKKKDPFFSLVLTLQGSGTFRSFGVTSVDLHSQKFSLTGSTPWGTMKSVLLLVFHNPHLLRANPILFHEFSVEMPSFWDLRHLRSKYMCG